MEENKVTEESAVTTVISVELEKWMVLHFQKIALEYERDDIRRKLWDRMSEVERLKEEVSSLKNKLEVLESEKESGFREINLIDIARKNAEVLQEEEE